MSVDQCRFEDWQPTSRFSLVFSAQAYHWIDPDVGLEKPRQVLGPGGAVALIWNVEQRISDALRVAVRRAYERHAPHLIDNFRYGPGRVRIATINRFAFSPLYRAIGRREFPWRQRYSAPEYIRLIGTYSKRRRLNAASRTALFETIEAAIADAGGSIDVAYDVMCCMFSPVAES